MNEFNFTHCFFILHPALPFNVAEPHIAVASCETSVVSQLIEGGLFINLITTVFIYVFLLFLDGKKGYSNLSGMNNLD